MYSHQKKTLQTELALFEFKHPFGTALDRENRWVRLATLVPWEKVEGEYSSHFGVSGNDAYPGRRQGCCAARLDFEPGQRCTLPTVGRWCERSELQAQLKVNRRPVGAPASEASTGAPTGRMALGALIIKERLNLTDEETVAQIQENPYLQYFIGIRKYSTKRPFDPSLMVHFRSRISAQMLLRVNEALCRTKKATAQKADDDKSDPPSNAGKLIIDATCAPEDMRHPTDLGLLNDSREHTERVIDRLWMASDREGRKPKTYRQKARRQFLKAIRCRKPSARHLRKGIR